MGDSKRQYRESKLGISLGRRPNVERGNGYIYGNLNLGL